jgi:hypothetical protein
MFLTNPMFRLYQKFLKFLLALADSKQEFSRV